MKKTLKITVAVFLLSFIFLPSPQQMLCEDSSLLWEFKPATDRSVHIKAIIPIAKGTDSYKFLEISEKIWIKDVKAYEYESGTPVEHKVYYDSSRDKQVIMLLFSQPSPDSFACGIEFVLADFMEERSDKVFIFEWWYRSEEEEFHTGVVILPMGTDLLDLQLKEPERVEEEEQIAIYYEGKSKGYNDFSFQLAFSPSGRTFLGMAERYEESGDLDTALSYYQRTMTLYGRYNFYAKTKPEFLKGIREKIVALQKITADSAFEDALEAFEQGEYEKAKVQFIPLENQYRILKDTERESQCREMIAECERVVMSREAEMLFERGKMQYDTMNYPSARESFVQAQEIFEELGDQEKLAECEKWLGKIEVVYRTILVGLASAVAIVLKLLQRHFSKGDTYWPET